jgi:hypothetical protein
VGGEAGEQRPGLGRLQPRRGPVGSAQADAGEAGQLQRVAGQGDRRQQVVEHRQAAVDQWAQQLPPRIAVGAEAARRGVERPVQEGGAAVQRVGQRDRRMPPHDAVLLEWERPHRR